MGFSRIDVKVYSVGRQVLKIGKTLNPGVGRTFMGQLLKDSRPPGGSSYRFGINTLGLPIRAEVQG
jgi:hypothetical protein